MKPEETTLLIDLGTNGEMVLRSEAGFCDGDGCRSGIGRRQPAMGNGQCTWGHLRCDDERHPAESADY